MRELGIDSIYHDMGNAAPRKESAMRFILARPLPARTPAQAPPDPQFLVRALQRPPLRPRYPLRVFEITDVREVGTAVPRAARRARPDHAT